jgi:hypothetical protein
VEGSASNRRNVRIVPTKPQTPTAVVAPMKKNLDMEVQAEAPSRDAAVETAKLVERVQGGRGITNVNVNHVGGWRDKMSKLRTRDAMQEEIDRRPEY